MLCNDECHLFLFNSLDTSLSLNVVLGVVQDLVIQCGFILK